MYSYIFEGKVHTDYSAAYMTSIGMDEEQQESALNQREFEREQLCQRLREQRDQRLTQARAWLERHRDEQMLGMTTTLPCTEQALLLYIQALRDVPQQPGFPDSIEWPELNA